MNPEDFALLRAALVAQRDALRGDGPLAIKPLRDDATSKIDNDVKSLHEMHQIIASRRNTVRTGSQRQIEAAIKRMDRYPDEYGLCEECEEPIPLPRLTLMPWSIHCVRCLSAAEDVRNGRRGRRKHLADFS